MLLCAGAAWIALPAFAQSQSDIVSGDVVVTGSRFEEKAADRPIGIVTLDGESIRSSGETSLPRVLARQPGIFSRDNSGSPDFQIDLRGFGITGDQNTLVLLDGRRMSEYELSSARWSSIPLDSIDRIEILRGSGAVLYGSGATGGVINVITRSVSRNARSFDMTAGAGSYDTQDFRLGGQVAGESVGLRVDGEHLASDNYRRNNRLVQDNLVADLRNFDPDRGFAVKVGAETQDLGLPGNRTEAELQTDRRGTRNPTDFSNREDRFAGVSGTVRKGDAEFAADLTYREKDNDFHALLGTTSLDGNTAVRYWQLSPRVRIGHEFFGMRNSLVAGLDAEWWDYSSERSNPASASARQTNLAAYLQNTAALDADTVVSLGLRSQGLAFDARDTVSASAAGSQNRSVTAYEAGLRRRWQEALSTYAKFGRSFRFATLDEIYAPGFGAFLPPSVAFLEPQTSHDVEVGAEGRAGRGSYRVGLYRSQVKNEIHFDSTAFANVNLPPTVRSGIELEGRFEWQPGVELYANYTYAEARFRSGRLGGLDVTGKRIPLVPRHSANAGADWKLPGGTRVTLAATYTGSQLYDGDELNAFGRRMPSWWTADIGVTHAVEAWKFGFWVRNAFDEKYYTYALMLGPPANFVAYPAAERNFFASATYRFGR